MKIRNSLDWQNIEQKLINLGALLPAFKKDVNRIIESLQTEVTLLSQLEVEDRRIHNAGTQRRCQTQAAKINEILKTIEKHHLMALLAQ